MATPGTPPDGSEKWPLAKLTNTSAKQEGVENKEIGNKKTVEDGVRVSLNERRYVRRLRHCVLCLVQL